MSSVFSLTDDIVINCGQADKRTEFLESRYIMDSSGCVCPVRGSRCIRDTFFADVPCFGCCQTCRELDQHAVVVSQHPIEGPMALKALMKHSREFHMRNKNTHVGNGKYLGPFAFTLTMSPSDNLTVDDMVAAVKKVMSQKSIPAVKYAWYLEYKDFETKEHPHIHGMYETASGRRIEAKHWFRAWKIWDESVTLGKGHRGGYHKPVEHDQCYDNYIKKQTGLVHIYDRKNV